MSFLSRIMVLDSIAQYFGVETGAIIAPVSILISTTIASIVAIVTVSSHRKNARLKNSMDFINGHNEDADISKALEEVKTLREKSSSDIEKMATTPGQCDNSLHIRIVLNYYESMAICIFHKIYDTTVLQEAIHTTVLDMWATCQPYVNERRKQDGKETYYQELDALVARWKVKPLKKKSDSWLKKIKP